MLSERNRMRKAQLLERLLITYSLGVCVCVRVIGMCVRELSYVFLTRFN